MRFATILAVFAMFTLASGALAAGGETIATATAIGALPFSDVGDTSNAMNDYDEVCPYTGSTSPDHVYAYTPSGDGLVDIDLCVGSAYDTKLYVYEDVATPTMPFACNDDECPGYVSQLLALQLNIGHTYYIVVDGYGGSFGAYTFDMLGDGGATAVEPSTWGSVKSIYR